MWAGRDKEAVMTRKPRQGKLGWRRETGGPLGEGSGRESVSGWGS